MKKVLTSLLILLTLFAHTSALPVAAQETGLDAKAAILIEASTGKILYEKDSETPIEIASISKLISAYLVYEALAKGEISMGDQVTISDYAYGLTLSGELSNIPLEGDSYTVQSLLEASIISSANSAMIALAEHVAGSEPAFVDRMRSKLQEWGITSAYLVNSTGVNNAYLGENIYPGSQPTDENKVSAADVAKIARRLLLDYPEILAISGRSHYQFDGEYYYTTNKMLESGAYARPGVDGLKTGTTDLAGASFVATATENGMRLISVALNTTEQVADPDNRFLVTNELLAYGYQNFQMKTLVEAGQPYHKSSVGLFNGQTKTARAVAAQNLQVVVRKEATEATLATFVAHDTEFEAPLQQGTSLGTLKVKDSDLIGKGYIDAQPSVDMVSQKTTPAASWPASWWNHFVRYVNKNL